MQFHPVTKAELITRHDAGFALERHYVVIRRLGCGSFGVVDLIRDRRTGEHRVCKTVNTKAMKLELLMLMKKEIRLLQELDHPRIVKLFEFVEDGREGKIRLIMEHLPGGDLEGLVKSGGRLSETLVAGLLQQVLSAAAYCHARGIIHCDLKPDNVLLVEPVVNAQKRSVFQCWDASSEYVECKVIDFGLAARFSQLEPESVRHFVGTPAFMAPEVVNVKSGGSFGPKADVWSVGVIAHYLLSGKLPFGHHDDFDGDVREVFDNIRGFRGLDHDNRMWEGRSAAALDCVSALMAPSAHARPSAGEILQHDWFRINIAVQPKKIRRRVLRSLRDFANAPYFVRVCLLLIAARADDKHSKRARQAFMRLDTVGSGVLTQEVLQDAITRPGGLMPCCCYPSIGDDVLREINLSNSGSIQYTEFAAALLYRKLGQTSGRDLATLAFAALDDDGDGLVSVDTILAFFSAKRAEDLNLADQFPVGRPFDEAEFYKCLRRVRRCSNRGSRMPFFCCGASTSRQSSFESLAGGSSENESDT